MAQHWSRDGGDQLRPVTGEWCAAAAADIGLASEGRGKAAALQRRDPRRPRPLTIGHPAALLAPVLAPTRIARLWLSGRGAPRCALETQVQADIAYTGDGHIKFHLGPVFLVLKGREAALSMRALIDKLAPVIDEMYPDLDAEMKRQHREILRQAALGSYSRARVNGTEPAAVVMARRAAYDVTT